MRIVHSQPTHFNSAGDQFMNRKLAGKASQGAAFISGASIDVDGRYNA